MAVWEFNFIIWFQSIGGSFLDDIQGAISFMGEEVLIVIILGIIYWGFDKELGALLGLTLFTSASINGTVKNIVKRARPHESDYLIKNKRPLEDYSYSYPSGHAQLSATIYPGIAFKYRRKCIIALSCVIPLLIAQSRVYLGVHFPSDVLGGLAIGLLITIGIYYLYERIKNRLFFYLILIIVSAPGLFFARTSDYFKSFGMLIGCISGVIFEQKFVNFTSTRLWWRIILRLTAGLCLFMGLRTSLKGLFNLLYFDSLWLDCIRYCILIFTGFGLYPLLFKYEERLFGKYESEATQIDASSKASDRL